MHDALMNGRRPSMTNDDTDAASYRIRYTPSEEPFTSWYVNDRRCARSNKSARNFNCMFSTASARSQEVASTWTCATAETKTNKTGGTRRGATFKRSQPRGITSCSQDGNGWDPRTLSTST